MLWLFIHKNEKSKITKQLWQPGNQPEEIKTEKVFQAKNAIYTSEPGKGWLGQE